MPFETFEHTADLGLRIWNEQLEALFAEAAAALFTVIAGDLSTIRPREQVRFELTGESLDYLLFDWLNELLYQYEVRHLLLASFDVRVRDGRLTATAHGEPRDPARHALEHEVKAITYHGLKVEQQANLWLAEVIVDI